MVEKPEQKACDVMAVLSQYIFMWYGRDYAWTKTKLNLFDLKSTPPPLFVLLV